MAKTLIAKFTLQYDEYPTPNWLEGEKYKAVEKDNILILESETGPFYFAGEARARLPEIFEEVIEE